jgi:hypothetical protein
MKILTPLLWLVILSQCTPSQKKADGTSALPSGEFTIYENGLIYDESTMSSLARIVDSLNLRFKSCTPKTYYPLEQGYGTYIFIKKKNIRKARAAIEKNITLDDFSKQFPRAATIDSVWILKSQKTEEEKPVLEYKGDEAYIMVPYSPSFDKTEGWIYQETFDGMDIFYLHGLSGKPIPDEYARFIQYVDCMIDTTSSIFPAKEIPDSLKYPFAPESKVKSFLDLALDFEPEPARPIVEGSDSLRYVAYQRYDSALKAWEARLLSALDQKMKNPANIQLLNDAVEESLINQNGMFLDGYAARYLPPARQLELKRSFRVRGFCSRDQGPREHAVSICMLAAKCRQWDIFLRAHLDILNDNFERAADSPSGWAIRGTYIKEIEELDINSVALVVGTILNAKDLDHNHYSASTWRVGRAMSESKYRKEFEDLLLQMICDERLDRYNRMEMAYALIYCNRHSKDETTYRANLERIKSALETLPGRSEEQFANLLDN